MFNQPLHFTQLKHEDLTSFSDKTLPDFRTIYKASTGEKKPYLIYLEQYSDNYFFIKFFPSRHRSNPNKYKLRTGEHKRVLPIKLLSTCLRIVVEKMNSHKNASFGFYGQWDAKDVYAEANSSQRYRIWRSIAIRKINDENFHFLSDSNFNFFLVVPKHVYNDDYMSRTQAYFENRFRSKLDELPIPSILEFETCKLQ